MRESERAENRQKPSIDPIEMEKRYPQSEPERAL